MKNLLQPNHNFITDSTAMNISILLYFFRSNYFYLENTATNSLKTASLRLGLSLNFVSLDQCQLLHASHSQTPTQTNTHTPIAAAGQIQTGRSLISLGR